MTRVVSVGRSKGLFLASILGFALLGTLAGCPGTLENPNAFPAPMSGAAGTQGAAGGGGPAGAGGPAGTGGGTCDAPTMVFDHYGCAIAGCHGTPNPAGGFDMQTAGWETMLKGTNSKGGGTGGSMSMCMGMGPYLVPGSNPATGLFIDKLTKAAPPCGAAMPNIGGPLTTAEKNCVIQWATDLAK
jgi:hypothetical protein